MPYISLKLRKWTSCCTKGNLIAESRTKPLLEHIYWDHWWGSHGSTWEAAPCWSFENNAGLPIGFTFQGHFLYSLLDSLVLLHYTVSHGYLCLSVYLKLCPEYYYYYYRDYSYTTSNILLNLFYSFNGYSGQSALTMELPGRRKGGRPHRSFMDGVKKDMQVVC